MPSASFIGMILFFARLRRELTAGLVADFVAQAKENGLTLQTVTELLQEEWGDEV